MDKETLDLFAGILERTTALMEAQQASQLAKTSQEDNSYFKGSSSRVVAGPRVKEMLGLVPKTKASNVQTATPLHGTGGIFSTPGLDRTVVTAYIRPHGIGNLLSKGSERG